MENIGQKFNTPQEEIDFLREQIKKREQETVSEVLDTKAEENRILEQIKEYKDIEPEKVVSEEYKITEPEAESIVLNLSPEEHDETMNELLGILEEKGVKNTLSVIEKMNNPHIEDDFHRVLVQYVKTGYLDRLPEKVKDFYKKFKITLYEVTLPEFKDGEEHNDLDNLIAPMEQFYAGMMSVQEKGNLEYFTIEMSVANDSNDLVMYSAVPDNKKDLFEKQILAVFPNAVIREKNNDYNLFNEGYVAKGSSLALYKKPVFALKTYDDFKHDPLNIVLNSLSKLSKEEGASIQFVLDTSDNNLNNKYKTILDRVQRGDSVSEAFNKDSILLGIGKALFTSSKSKDKTEEKHIDQSSVESIQQKISQPIVNLNIRIVVSTQTETRTDTILSEIESAFNQFESPTGNRFVFTRPKGQNLKKFLKNFSFRLLDKSKLIPLNMKELSTIAHFSASHIKSTDILKQAKSTTASAPQNTSGEGVLLGVNNHRGVKTNIYINEEDRLRHFYVIGQTGTGKTTLLKNMITQDILAGRGVCLIDPHGSDIDDILSIIPEERYEDVIYFDPANTKRAFALNMLEYDTNYPEQKTFVVDEMLSIFNKLFDMKTAGGPMFEQYFRQAVLLVIDHPESGNTLADISRVLSNKEFREMKLSVCKNENVVSFWRDIAGQAGGEASLQNIVPYITSKFDVFLSNEIMRPIVTQPKSSFNFREIMDGKKILLVNLSKGRLGEINSNLIGLIIVGKLLMAALSRTGLNPADMNSFYLYIDEFQNVTTDSISTILSEARKYKLSLNIAHQFIKQLEEGIKDSVFGNVGSMAVFRVGADDAEYLEKQFAPNFTAKDILDLDNRNAYVKMLVNGQPVKPFNMETIAPMKGNLDKIEKLKEFSYLRYGKGN